MTTLPLLRSMLEARLTPPAAAWLTEATREIADGAVPRRFGALFAMASRHSGKGLLAPDAEECEEAGRLLEGWNPERWRLMDALRAALVLSHPELEGEGLELALEETFRYAEVGELVALYRCLAHLPAPERFLWRAGEGARTNMRVVFEATCCDTPYPARFFDEVAWRSAVVKALFVEAPLWRFWGLDTRLSPELARVALDLADERRSADRPVNPETWLCLGDVAGERGLASIELELERGDSRARASAALALARAGEGQRLVSLRAVEGDPLVRTTMTRALEGRQDSIAFGALDAP